MAEHKPPRRCAIYTRKSSEEGLEQTFNSLDAQREACAAYIVSQRQEGWREVPTTYDDGGYSGGTLERPALQQLLADIRAGQIDRILVYKIDRLTRSLTDFASLVTVFDAHATSFVSVTQHFNTTTSMGRLTLNVLLSFAQFEREVTGERIRDKIAASKRKGMWMGGTVPLGYRSVDKMLIAVPEEAAQVRRVFERYCALGSVAKLQEELQAAGEVCAMRLSATGRTRGGEAFSRGALYHVLQNRVYRGEIPHRERFYPGMHEAIVPKKLWESAQSRLANNREAKHLRKGARGSSLLAGLVQDDSKRPLTPSHTGKRGKRYRYYIGRPTKEHRRPGLTIPAYDLERLVENDFCALLRAEDLDQQLSNGSSQDEAHSQAIRQAGRGLSDRWKSLPALEKRSWFQVVLQLVTVHRESILIHWKKRVLGAALVTGLPSPITASKREINAEHDESIISRSIQAQLQRCGSEIRIIGADMRQVDKRPVHHMTLLNAVARAQHWYEQIAMGSVRSMAAIAKAEGLADRYVSRLLGCAYLAPSIVDALISGEAPHDLTLTKVLDDLPQGWAAQRQSFGFGTYR